MVLGAPIDLALLVPAAERWLVACGVLALFLMASWLPRALRRCRPDEARTLAALTLSAALALLIGAAALPGERVLLPAGVGAAAVMAALVRDGYRGLREPRRRWLAALGAALLVLTGIVLSAVALPVKGHWFGQMATSSRHVAREAEVDAPGPARVVVLHLPDLQALLLPLVRAAESGASPARLAQSLADRERGQLPAGRDGFGLAGSSVLSLGTTEHQVRRTGVDRRELFTPTGTLLDGAWAGLFRTRRSPLPPGTEIATEAYRIRVLDARAGRPTRIEVRFDRSLDYSDPGAAALAGGRWRTPCCPPCPPTVAPPPPSCWSASPRVPPSREATTQPNGVDMHSEPMIAVRDVRASAAWYGPLRSKNAPRRSRSRPPTGAARPPTGTAVGAGPVSKPWVVYHCRTRWSMVRSNAIPLWSTFGYV